MLFLILPLLIDIKNAKLTLNNSSFSPYSTLDIQQYNHISVNKNILNTYELYPIFRDTVDWFCHPTLNQRFSLAIFADWSRGVLTVCKTWAGTCNKFKNIIYTQCRINIERKRIINCYAIFVLEAALSEGGMVSPSLSLTGDTSSTATTLLTSSSVMSAVNNLMRCTIRYVAFSSFVSLP